MEGRVEWSGRVGQARLVYVGLGKGEGRVKWSGVGAWYGTVNGRTGEGEGRGEYSEMEWSMTW